MTRYAACSCEQLRLWVEGEPVRISICHCLACQRRTGSVFGFQARFPAGQVRTEGRYAEYVRISDHGEERVFSFCPECGATVFYRTEGAPDLVAVPVGAFADPSSRRPECPCTSRDAIRGSSCPRASNTRGIRSALEAESRGDPSAADSPLARWNRFPSHGRKSELRLTCRVGILHAWRKI